MSFPLPASSAITIRLGRRAWAAAPGRASPTTACARLTSPSSLLPQAGQKA
ncbi:hypothetical protein [Janthinobacterium lividum]|uniref:hypothetical protein n=1 Tax=Janthinobacterium lividum TaxID=29581 RepID=UPI001E45A930|nr:hypothetical protein [Janthinobacterium lividum]WQE27919.1 hypothetical protein U0004_23485 [Janthinobacterium lividum]